MVPHEKPLKVLLSERKAPGFESVTVTVLPLALGVLRPSCEAQTPMALVAPLPRFVAKPGVVPLIAKLAVRFGAAPPHEAEVEPSVPPVMAVLLQAWLKLEKLVVSVMPFPGVPGVTAVILTTR